MIMNQSNLCLLVSVVSPANISVCFVVYKTEDEVSCKDKIL